MPPKMPGAPSAHLAATLDAALAQTMATSSTCSSSSTSSAALALRPARTSLTTRRSSSRAFSTTTSRSRITSNRYKMLQWLDRRGNDTVGSNSRPGPAYLGEYSDQPFPLNPFFRSEPVLSDMLKNKIWKRVMEDGDALKAVSQEYGVDVRRIAAVVRLKEVEKKMQDNNLPMAQAYSKAVNQMLPQTRLEDNPADQRPHEAINEVPMHPYTMQQLFVPVSESRQFTREDAAKAFHDHLLPADERSYQKELIAAERSIAEGRATEEQAMEQYKKDVQRVEEEYATKMAERMAEEAARTKSYATGRAAFRIKDIKVEDAGRDGRSPKGVGWRYGAPHQDRKRGLVKIPTQVP